MQPQDGERIPSHPIPCWSGRGETPCKRLRADVVISRIQVGRFKSLMAHYAHYCHGRRRCDEVRRPRGPAKDPNVAPPRITNAPSNPKSHACPPRDTVHHQTFQPASHRVTTPPLLPGSSPRQVARQDPSSQSSKAQRRSDNGLKGFQWPQAWYIPRPPRFFRPGTAML